MRKPGTVLLLLFATTTFALAQGVGTLRGRVKDRMGAAIGGAHVHVVGPSERQILTFITNERGDFFAPNIRPGQYKIHVEARGFLAVDRDTVDVRAGRARVEGFVLDVDPDPRHYECVLYLTAADQAEVQDATSIKNFFRVNEQVCTGGQPTMEELEKLKAEGVKAIINLRMPSEYNSEEEAAKAKALGLRYFHIPFNNNDPKDEAVDQFLKVMADKQNLPVFIHCTTANRVGGFWMIRRVLVDGWTVEQAEDEAGKIGLRNPKTREFALSYIERHKKNRD